MTENDILIESIPVFSISGEQIGSLNTYDSGEKQYVIYQQGRRDFKDRLFRFIFGSAEHKEWALSLYNSIEHTHYDNTDDLQLATLENAVYMNMKNDVAVLVGSWNWSFWEHQSTINPNIPVRMLSYFASTVSRYLFENNIDIYAGKKIRLPRPKFYVFYNGKETVVDFTEPRLSSLYNVDGDNTEPQAELIVTQININGYKNSEDSCVQLYEYQWFVEKIREYTENTDIGTAVTLALNEMPENFTIRNYLLANKSEVLNMCIFEYNEKLHLETVRREGIDIGEKTGIKNSFALLKSLGLPDDEIISRISAQYQCSSDYVREVVASAA